MRFGIVILLIVVALTTGSAGSAPNAKFVQQPKKDVRIDSNGTSMVSVNAASDVEILDLEKQRLQQLIEQKISSKSRSVGSTDPEVPIA